MLKARVSPPKATILANSRGTWLALIRRWTPGAFATTLFQRQFTSFRISPIFNHRQALNRTIYVKWAKLIVCPHTDREQSRVGSIVIIFLHQNIEKYLSETFIPFIFFWDPDFEPRITFIQAARTASQNHVPVISLVLWKKVEIHTRRKIYHD